MHSFRRAHDGHQAESSRGGGTGGIKNTAAGELTQNAPGRSAEGGTNKYATGKNAGRHGDASSNSRMPWPWQPSAAIQEVQPACWIGSRLLGESFDGPDFAARATMAGALAAAATSAACRRQHAQQPDSPHVSLPALVASRPGCAAAAAAASIAAASRTNAGGSTPCASAQATFSRIVMQQQPCQHWSAFMQPQGRSMQGNGLLRSLTGADASAGSGKPVTSTS